MTAASRVEQYEIREIMALLPHRYPFLLIDRVLELVPGERARAIKNVTINEPFFTGHFPGRPLMPGVLILEALAQAAGVLAFRTSAETPAEGGLYYFVGIDKARFKRTVEPGDQLVLDIVLKKRRRDVWCFGAEARVNSKLACSAELMCAWQRPSEGPA